MASFIATVALFSGAFAAVAQSSLPSARSSSYSTASLPCTESVAFSSFITSPSVALTSSKTSNLESSVLFTVGSSIKSSGLEGSPSSSVAAASILSSSGATSTSQGHGYNASNSALKPTSKSLRLYTASSAASSGLAVSALSGSELTPVPTIITLYATTTVTPPPIVTETTRVSTLTLTSSITATYALCETSVSTTISSGTTIAVTHTRTVYRHGTTTLTSTEQPSSSTVASSSLSSASISLSSILPMSSESTTTLELTLTTTTRPTLTSTVSESTKPTADLPTTVILTRTRHSTIVVHPTIPIRSHGASQSTSTSDKSTIDSPVIFSHSTASSGFGSSSLAPASQIYSQASGSLVFRVTSFPTTHCNNASTSSTIALPNMGTTSSMLSASIASGPVGHYNTSVFIGSPTAVNIVQSTGSTVSKTITEATAWPAPDTQTRTGFITHVSPKSEMHASFDSTCFTNHSTLHVSSGSTSTGTPTVATAKASSKRAVSASLSPVASSSTEIPISTGSASGRPIGGAAGKPAFFIDESSILGITSHTNAPSLATEMPRTSVDNSVDFIVSSARTSTRKGASKLSATSIKRPANVTATSGTSTPTSSKLSASTSCGESGDFVLTWEDEPTFVPSANASSKQFPPVFNPYHHLFFASGYSYIYDTIEPYPAFSEPTLALWQQSQSNEDTGSPDAGTQVLNPGEIGAGPRSFSDAYWFNATEGYFGCLNQGPGTCQLMITGYIWDEYNKIEMPGPSMTVAVPTCIGYKDCKLFHVAFDGADFTGLSGIQFQMTEEWPSVSGSNLQNFVLDNLALGWYNNTCEAGLLRISQRK